MKKNRLPLRQLADRNDVWGFTLFELLVSISIIAILTALAIVSFSSAQKKARDARRIQDMQSLSKAAELYYAANNASYPVTFGTGVTWPGVLEAFPQDPKGVGYTNPTSINPAFLSTTGYCFCAYIEGATGNSTNQSCTFSTAAGNNWFCVKNQQ